MTKCHRPKPQYKKCPSQPPTTKFSGISYSGVLSVAFRPDTHVLLQEDTLIFCARLEI